MSSADPRRRLIHYGAAHVHPNRGRVQGGARCVKNGKVKPPAFRRRWQFKDSGEVRETWDDDGLSFGLTPQDACQGLEENFGVLRLSVERMEARGFQFDEPAQGHVNVTNMPFYRAEERDLASAKSLQMLECVEEILPPVQPQE